jgi:SAM-dependent methyltransferase
VRGKTFADIGGLWGTTNEMVSVALDAGAAEATMIDIAPADNQLWRDLDSHLAKKGDYAYRRIIADACSPRFSEIVGPFDIVHCSGVIYHAPDPMTVLANLRAITRECGILTSMTVPELIENDAGVIDLRGGGTIFVPGLDASTRPVMARYFTDIGLSLDTILDARARWCSSENGLFNYAPWWWFLTPQTVTAMTAAAGLSIVASGESWSAGAYSLQYRPTQTHSSP